MFFRPTDLLGLTKVKFYLWKLIQLSQRFLLNESYILFLNRLRQGYIFWKYSNNINISDMLLLCIAPEFNSFDVKTIVTKESGLTFCENIYHVSIILDRFLQRCKNYPIWWKQYSAYNVV